MLRKLQLVVMMLAISFASFAQIHEDFESYNAGQKLVQQALAQGNDYWTTWSNTPGSAEDPNVSSDYAQSGSKSVVIQGTNDAVMLLGNQTQGVFDISFSFLVPTGHIGYFNILQAFAGASSQWGMQCFLDLNGTASVDAGAQGAGTFFYNYDTWTLVEFTIDLDNDFAEMFVEGSSVVTWTWSGGTFGTGTLNQLGAINLYAWNENGTPKAYFDDIHYAAVTSVTLLDDFESYNAGGKLVQQALAQNIDYWTCWSGNGGAGGNEDGTISTDQAFSGNKSVLCQGVNDFVLLLGNKTAGKYSVEFYMYVPTGFVGYYNVLQSFNPNGVSTVWGLEIYYNPGGIAVVTAAATPSYATFNYPYNSWFKMENIIDLNNDVASILIDGNQVATWQWSLGASGGGLNQLAAVDIYAAATNGTPKFYIDDIQLIELEPAVGPAQIVVNPAAINVSLESGQSSTQTLGITNNGIAKLVWNAYPNFGMNDTEAIVYDQNVDYRSLVEETSMIETKGEAYPGTDATHVFNYDGENASAVGLTGGGTFEFGAKFPTNLTNPYIGMEINQVQVFVNSFVSASKVKVYGHGTMNSPGALLAEQTFTAILGWNNVNLNTPVIVNGGDIWITCQVTHLAGDFPAGNDAGPHTTNGDWFSTGASWVQLHQANPAIDANWNIRGIAVGDPSNAWITLNPQSGEANTGQTNNVAVTVNAAGVPAGTYTANIVINSNDPVTPQKLVPVTMTVSGGGPVLDPPTNLVSQVDGNDVLLTWTSPAPPPAFFEGFEGTFPPAGWAKLNPDGGTGWQSQAVGAALPGWTGGTATAPPNGGGFQAYCTWTTGGAASNDQWLVTPQITVANGSMLEFYMIYYFSSYNDHVEIRISTTTQNNPAAYNVVVDMIDFTSTSSTEWQLYSYNLTDFVPAGTNVYIGFRENVANNFNDGSAIAIDNVYVGVGNFLDAVDNTPVAPSLIALAGTRDYDTPHVPSHRVVAGANELLSFNVYRNGTKIAEGITGTEFTDENLSSGLYTWYVTAVYTEGESGPSNVVTEIIVSVNEVDAKTFTVYPNPANGVVSINSNAALKSVKMMNYTGQVVYNNVVSGYELKINTDSFASGVYILQIETTAGVASQKLIIE